MKKIILLLCCVGMLSALVFFDQSFGSAVAREGNWFAWWNTGLLLSQVTNDTPFQGLENKLVVPLLKNLPYQYGGMNIPAQDGRFLHDLILEKGYQRGLEIGTSNGYSALWLGLAFQKTGGQLITLEIEPKRAQEARRNFQKAGLGQVIDSRINDAFKEIPQLGGDFDFIFLDAWKPDYIKFFKLLRPRLRAGGALTAHNVISQKQALEDFLTALQQDRFLTTTIHKTSPAGISVSIVKSN